jgi:nitrate reductase beta subunit
MGGSGPFGESSGGPQPIAVENFHMLRERQTTDTIVDPGDRAARVNLLNWDGKGRPAGLFPSTGADGSPPETDTPGGGDPDSGLEPKP